jgi:hypothetical protein
VLAAEPENAKALFRRAQYRTSHEQWASAIEVGRNRSLACSQLTCFSIV